VLHSSDSPSDNPGGEQRGSRRRVKREQVVQDPSSGTGLWAGIPSKKTPLQPAKSNPDLRTTKHQKVIRKKEARVRGVREGRVGR
jgi:hypothetical protein